MTERTQLDLFGGRGPGSPGVVGLAPAAHALRDLAARLPANLHLGTSSWSFPGWTGLVWDRSVSERDLARFGLHAYAQHPLLNAVGVDRTHYEPVSEDVFAAWADAVPDGFSFLVKAHEALTLSRWPTHARYGKKAGDDNPLFLDPSYAAEEVVGPMAAGLGDKSGPLLFQFAAQDFGGPQVFADRLRAFLGALPDGPLVAVQVRNPELLTRAYADALADHGAVHCINVHATMPDVRTQVERAGVLWGPALVVRWMLRRNLGYAEARARYTPFDRLVDEDPETRTALAGLIREWERPVWVIANNKAEGCSPLTLQALAEEVVG